MVRAVVRVESLQHVIDHEAHVQYGAVYIEEYDKRPAVVTRPHPPVVCREYLHPVVHVTSPVFEGIVASSR